MDKEAMEKLARRIQKIEDINPDYVNNLKWQILRKQQNQAFIDLAKEEIEYYQSVVDRYENETEEKFVKKKIESQQRIDLCNKFIEQHQERGI